MLALWAGAVGVDSARSSDMVFDQFENSWIAQDLAETTLHRLAVAPFPGDDELAARVAAALQQATALQVVTPDNVTLQAPTELLAGLPDRWTEHQAGEFCRELAKALQVDGVLMGRVVEGQPERSLWPWKTKHPKRLYLYLVTAEGRTLWRDELPFTLVHGSKNLEAAFVERALVTKLSAHSVDIGLTDLINPRPGKQS